MQTRWEHFEHGADIGVRSWSASKTEAFEQAALAMMVVITAPEAVQTRDTLGMECEAPDDEMLLVDQLAERGIVVMSASSRGVAEEAPGAYKDIGAVVDATDAAGLARKVARLEPLICIQE